MAAIEFLSGGRSGQRLALEGASCTIGSDADSVAIVITDTNVSRVHALLERVGSVWLLRDLGSRNGTMVNGALLTGQRRLRDGDEIIVGRTRLAFRDILTPRHPTTDSLAPPPANLTRKEREVLIELCRPLLSHNAFQPPASVREIMDRLYITKNGVQAHLTNLYTKFGVHGDEASNRRVRLANEAVQRGAVTIADLRGPSASGDPHG